MKGSACDLINNNSPNKKISHKRKRPTVALDSTKRQKITLSDDKRKSTPLTDIFESHSRELEETLEKQKKEREEEIAREHARKNSKEYGTLPNLYDSDLGSVSTKAKSERTASISYYSIVCTMTRFWLRRQMGTPLPPELPPLQDTMNHSVIRGLYSLNDQR